MKKFSKFFALFLALTLSCALLATPAYADSPDWLNGLKEGASGLWNAAKDKGSEIVDTVRTEGPGWVETGKEKVGDAIDKAGEVITDTQQGVSEWNAEQQQQFWDRTEQMINGGGTNTTSTPAQATPSSTAGLTDEDVQATIDPDFVNRSEKIVSEWLGTEPDLEPTPDLSFVDRSDEFTEELRKAHAGEYSPDGQSAGSSTTSIDDEVERMRNEIFPSAEPEMPGSVASTIPIVGDIAALASALPEQNVQNPESTSSPDPAPIPSELAGTLFYRGQWYRETQGNADVVYAGRAFAKTDWINVSIGTELEDAIILDGKIIQLSRTDYNVQEVKSAQPDRRLTDGDIISSILIALGLTFVIGGVIALILQHSRKTKDQ